jgi:hypothetical protein
MGDYSVLRGRLLSEKAEGDTYINMRPGPYASYYATACSQSNFFRVDTLKKSWPVPHIKSTVVRGNRLKHFYLEQMLILKIVALKQLIRKICIAAYF